MSAFHADAERLLARVHREIPLTQAMQLGLRSFDGHTLVLDAPLAANINDKGTAFAGSITALGNITGWCLLTLWSEREFAPCRVAIADAHFSFRQPLRGDFTATVALPDEAECLALLDHLRRKGRGKARLQVKLADAAGEGAVLEGVYALWREDA